MTIGIKLNFIRIISKFFLKIGGNYILTRPSLRPNILKSADFILKYLTPENGIFEIDGFKIKRGRARYLMLVGDYEPSTTALIKKEVKKGMQVFDLGAGIGWFTLVMSKLVGSTGHVYAFEPDPNSFKILQENVELNNIKNVSIFQLAVSNKTGVAKFSLIKNKPGANVLESRSKTENRIDVKTTTLDEFCREHNVKIDFLKMDVEGSEPKVFEGMTNMISENPKIKIISEFYSGGIIDVGYSPKDYLNSLLQSGFNINQIDHKKLGNFFPFQIEKLTEKNYHLNLFCFQK